MALVLPIILALVSGFIGIMYEIIQIERLDAAVGLAANAAIGQAPGNPGAICQAATAAFASTMFGGPVGGTSSCSLPPTKDPYDPAIIVNSFDCTSTVAGFGNGYLAASSPNASAPVTCTGTVSIDYNSSPLGWALSLYHPKFTASAVATPTGYRQCAAGISTCTNN